MDKKDMEKARIISTLDGEGEKNRFYVYALCDENHKPFYIGKGQGGRVWEHEKGEEKEREAIEKNEKLSLDEKKILLNDLSEKHKKINEIKKRGFEVEKVIIKWGLTENEAFMAESALINFYNYPEVTLANIANGHASESEKENAEKCIRSKATEAMNEMEFLESCCKELLIFKDGDDIISEESVSEKLSGRKFLFINIRDNYSFCKGCSKRGKDWETMETARASWQVGKDRKLPDYIFAVSNSVIRGIYKVKAVKSVCEAEKQGEGDFPEFPDGMRKREFELIKQIEESSPKKYKDLSDGGKKFEEFIDIDKLGYKEKESCQELMGEDGSQYKKMKSTEKPNETDYQKEYENWKNRRYFICEQVDEKTRKLFVGKVIKKKEAEDIYKAIHVQNPLRYNY